MGMVGNFGSHYPSHPADDAAVINWYDYSWNAVLRSTNKQLAELSANMQIAACNNNNVIYIYGGLSYHQRLKECNYDPSAISVECGTDCMGSVFANIKGACHRLNIDCSNVPDMSTTAADSLMNIGYEKFTDSDHVSTDAHAQRGDVYVKYGSHACMHVGDGNYDGSSTGTIGGVGVSLNLEVMSPYVLIIPENDVTFKGDVFLDSQVCAVALKAGYLYTSRTHIQKSSYINKNLHTQVQRCKKFNLPFALIAEVRARTIGEAKNELNKLYYVCASAVPDIGLWLHLDFSTTKTTNNRILQYYMEECSKWGFKNSLGIYVTKEELENIDWDNFSEDMYLWKVDHSVSVANYIGVLPFSIL